MRKLMRSALLLTCALGTSGCALSGKAVKQDCPKPTEPPASLMQSPTTGQKVRAELFEPQTKPTPR